MYRGVCSRQAIYRTEDLRMVDALPHVSFVSLSCALSPITAKSYGDICFNPCFLQIQANSAHHSPVGF